MSEPIQAQFAAMDGASIPGGCDYCDAVQVITAGSVIRIEVRHADGCEWFYGTESAAE